MRADGSEFPVEIAITRPRLDGPPQFTGYLRDVTRAQARRAGAALAGRRSRPRCGASRRPSPARPTRTRLFAVVTEEVGRLLGANSSNMVRFEPDGTGVVVGGWSTGGVARGAGRDARDARRADRRRADPRSGRPERVDSFEGMEGSTAEMLRGLGFRSAVGAPIKLAGRLWGAVMVSSVRGAAFPAGTEQRIADFAELVALALANAEAREELAASRARIVEAGDAERRRLERNLHDGAQQRLVALSLTLRLAEQEARRGRPRGAASCSSAPTPSSPTRSRSCASSPAASIPRSSPTAGSARRCEMLAGAGQPARSSCAPTLDERLPGRSRRPPTTSWPRRSPTPPSTRAPRACGCASAAADGIALVEVADDGVGGADQRGGSGLRGLARPRRGARRHARAREPGGRRHDAQGAHALRLSARHDGAGNSAQR